jgi:hypothetical protein
MQNTKPRWIPTRSATPSTALVPQRKVGFPIPNPRLLLGFQGTKSARREGISSPFSDAGGCTSPQNSGGSRPQDWRGPHDHHPNIHMRWGNSAEKRRWMRSLAMLLKAVEDSASSRRPANEVANSEAPTSGRDSSHLGEPSDHRRAQGPSWDSISRSGSTTNASADGFPFARWPLGCAWHKACCLGCMGSYFGGGRWSCPMFNARPFAIQFTRHELRIFAEMQLFSAVPLPGKHANTIADLSTM